MTEDRIVREHERRKMTGLARTTWFLLERRGLAPKRVVLVGGARGWKLSELQAWIADRRPAA
jgi:prophage regulatory protein